MIMFPGELLDVKLPKTGRNKDARKLFLHLLDSLNPGDISWGSYFIILKEEHKLIGSCGFKGNPD